ncbi:SPARC-related modular calcium-binding protein 2 isoform X3 [Cotesia glomerata]|uniref:SPARC-related modular calcium-binding protein 2 isoform X3 n=1 Tax=Cotesia glomerata TaxID=32391 RepID=UPI001D02AE29|nr:SPARC-related modular calcium-binding protein 2 isoform X3 [Cotesia glomerata]
METWNSFILKMILFFVVLSLAFKDCQVVGNTTVAIAKEECRKKIAECSMFGKADTPVCGSDGVTYPSQCQVISRQCEGESILIKHKGPCPETPACFSARVTARPTDRPICRPDGTYAPVQCHKETGYCWCVTPQGRPLLGTSVKYQKPKCPEKRLSSTSSTLDYLDTSSRSPEKLLDDMPNSSERRRTPKRKQKRQFNNRHRNNCDRTEKAKFNSNLIENFKIEYRRTNNSNNGDKNVERILTWKFTSLDKDEDGYLDRAEYKELRKLAKKAIRPKKCARTFAKNCDLNHDLKLSRQEWSTCLANDFTRRREVSEALKTRALDQVLKENPSPVHTRPTFNDDSTTKEESDAIDCITDRKSALEDSKHSSQSFYVPECTPDGRYLKVQCYSSYCFCVDQDTGKPIPGTSSKEPTPNCHPAPPPNRPMKGCPDEKKKQFLRDLIDLMDKKMKTSSADSVEATDKWPASQEERIATWHFVMLDKNKNKVLERKEWKSFRTMVASNRHLRRCGKKLPRYCDINNDRRISMTEWLSCLHAQQPNPVESSTNTSTLKPRRLGPNPLDQFLNADD